jgi:hypothetical protein
MSDAPPIPTHEVVLPSPPENKWRREYRAFLRMLPGLLPTYRGKYVAVHNGQVVDSDDDEIALALRIYRQHGYVPIHIGLVTDEPPRVERIPTPRIIGED